MVAQMTCKQQAKVSRNVALAVPCGSAELTVRWVPTIDDLPEGLFDACFHEPLEGSWWYSALEKSKIEDQFNFAYAVAYRGDIAIAVAPTFAMKVPMDLVAPEFVASVFRVAAKIFRGIDFQNTLFVGSVCADEGTVGVMPGVTLQQVIPAIVKAVEQRGKQLRVQVIAWKDFVDADAEVLEKSLCEDNGYFKMPSYPGAVVPLPKGGFENYLNSLPRSKRQKLKRKLKISRQQGELVSSVVQHPDQSTLDEIFGLFWQTYEKGKTKFERLTPEFFTQISATDKSHFILLRNVSTGKLVAFMLCFDLGKRVINKFIGLDYKLEGEWYLYFRIWEAAVSWVMSTGAVELQSGQTGYCAKFDIGHNLVSLTNYCKNLNPIMHRIYSHVSKEISWATLDSDLAVHLQAHPDDKD